MSIMRSCPSTPADSAAPLRRSTLRSRMTAPWRSRLSTPSPWTAFQVCTPLAVDNEGSDGRQSALERARSLSEAMRRLAANIDRTRTVVLFGNRRAENSPDDREGATPGGRALRFYSSVRLGVQRGHLVKDCLG